MHKHSVITNLEYLKTREKRTYLINLEKRTLKEITQGKYMEFSEDQGFFFNSGNL